MTTPRPVLTVPADMMRPGQPETPVQQCLNLQRLRPQGRAAYCLRPLPAPGLLCEGDWTDILPLGPCAAGYLYRHDGQIWLLGSRLRQMTVLCPAGFNPGRMMRRGGLIHLINDITGQCLLLLDAMPRPRVLGVIEQWPALRCEAVEAVTLQADIATRTLSRAYDQRGAALSPTDRRGVTDDLHTAYNIIQGQAQAQGRLTGAVLVQAQLIGPDGGVLHTTEAVETVWPEGMPFTQAVEVTMDATMTTMGQYSIEAPAFKIKARLEGTLPEGVAEVVKGVRLRLSPQMHNVDWALPCTLVSGGPGRQQQQIMYVRLPLCDYPVILQAMNSRMEQEALAVGEYTLGAMTEGGEVLPTLDVHTTQAQRVPRLQPLPSRLDLGRCHSVEGDDVVLYYGTAACQGIMAARAEDAALITAHIAVEGDVLTVVPMRMGRWYANQLHHYIVMATSGVYDLYCDGQAKGMRLSRRGGVPAVSDAECVAPHAEGLLTLTQGRLRLMTTSATRTLLNELPYTSVKALPDGRVLLTGAAGSTLLHIDDHLRMTLASIGTETDAQGLEGRDNGLYDVFTPCEGLIDVQWEWIIALPAGVSRVSRLWIPLQSQEAHLTVELNGRRWRIDGPVLSPLSLTALTAPGTEAHLTVSGRVSPDTLIGAVRLY